MTERATRETATNAVEPDATPVFERRIPRSGRIFKELGNLLADVAAAPVVLAFRIAVRIWSDRRDPVYQGFSQFMSLWPGFSGNYLRRAFYRRTLISCSKNCQIGFGTILATPNVIIGSDVYIGARCMIAHAVIEDDVLIGSNVDIVAGRQTHYFQRIDLPIRLQGGRHETVRIGRDSWIGNGATVAANVGDQAIVAAGAVVVKPVLPRAIVGGNPARSLGLRGAPEVGGSMDDEERDATLQQ